MRRPHRGSKFGKPIDLVAASGRTRPRARLGLESLEDRVVPTVTLSIADPVPFTEGNSGTSFMMFVVTRAGDAGDLESATQVDFGTVDGTAVAGVDYQATDGTMTFSANETTAVIRVPIIGNTTVQSNRTFGVNLSNPLQQAPFATPASFATGSGSSSVAWGDVNGDGRLDLAVANFAVDSVTVLLNTTTTGATSFAALGCFAAGLTPVAVAFGDVNGDGRLDLAVANAGSNTVSVLLNTTTTGATTPAFATQQNFNTADYPSSVALGDVNGDGLLDIVTANYDSASVSVLLNTTTTGATTPTFATQQEFDTFSDPTSVALGDVNGDGLLDLAVSHDGDYRVSVLLNTTTSGVVGFGTMSFRLTNSIYSVALGDVNGDGLPDLVTANSDSETVSVLLNTTTTGETTPTFATQQNFYYSTNPSSVAVGDVNGDGLLDLAVANAGSASVSVLLNTTTTGATTPTFATQQPFNVGLSPYSVALGDVNGDGSLDIVTANYDSETVSVLLNTTTTGVLNFATQQNFNTADYPISVALGDVNGDGLLDIVTANFGANSVSVLLNTTTTGVLSFAAEEEFITGLAPRSVTLGDVNGDGLLDIVTADSGANSVSVLLNTTTTGATTPTFAIRQPFDVGVSPFSVTLGDVNGDGRLDLVTANYNLNNVSVLLNTTKTVAGVTTFNFAAERSFDTGFCPISVALSDVSGDGSLDLVTANNGLNDVSVLLNMGVSVTLSDGSATGTIFDDDSAPPPPPPASSPPSVVATGPGTAAQVNVLNPDGSIRLTIQPFGEYLGGTTTSNGDVTNDGVADIVVGAGAGAAGGHVKVFDGVTGAEIRSFFAFDGFTGGVTVGSGDVNSDGVADIVVGAGAGAIGGHVKVFDGVTGEELYSFFAFEGFSGGFTVGSGDVTGDGVDDIVVGAGAGAAGPHVKVFDGVTGAEIRSFFAFDVGFVGGVTVGVGDVTGDGIADIVVGAGPGAGSHVKVFDGDTGEEIRSFFAFDAGFVGGVTVGVSDVNGDGVADIMVGAGPGAGPHVKSFDGLTGDELQSFFAFDEFSGGVFVG